MSGSSLTAERYFSSSYKQPWRSVLVGTSAPGPFVLSLDIPEKSALFSIREGGLDGAVSKILSEKSCHNGHDCKSAVRRKYSQNRPFQAWRSTCYPFCACVKGETMIGWEQLKTAATRGNGCPHLSRGAGGIKGETIWRIQNRALNRTWRRWG